MNLIPLPAFQDNYLWLLHDGQRALVVDPGDAGPVQAHLAAHGLQLDAILVTHHHPDHIGGNENLRKAGLQVFAGPGAGAIRDAAEGAAVIAHENVLNRMSAPTGKQAPYPTGAWPTDRRRRSSSRPSSTSTPCGAPSA